jgi:RNA polymerase sigma-70 factor (ECF subfamily)
MSNLNSPQCLEWLRKAQSGDLKSFLAIVSAFENRVYNLARYVLGRATDTEEVIQAVFLTAAREIHEFQDVPALRSAILKATVSSALTKLGLQERHWGEAQGRLIDVESLFETGQDYQWEAKIEQTHSLSEIQNLLAGALFELSVLNRTVLILRDIEELSLPEIAQVLGTSLANTNSRLLQARLQLRRSLSKHFWRNRSKSISGESRD